MRIYRNYRRDAFAHQVKVTEDSKRIGKDTEGLKYLRYSYPASAVAYGTLSPRTSSNNEESGPGPLVLTALLPQNCV